MFSESRNVQKRATKSDTSGHCLASIANRSSSFKDKSRTFKYSTANIQSSGMPARCALSLHPCSYRTSARGSIFHISHLFGQSPLIYRHLLVACPLPIYLNLMAACTSGDEAPDYFMFPPIAVSAGFDRDWLSMHVKDFWILYKGLHSTLPNLVSCVNESRYIGYISVPSVLCIVTEWSETSRIFLMCWATRNPCHLWHQTPDS